MSSMFTLSQLPVCILLSGVML